MDMPKAPTLETQENDFTIKHESFSFETPHFSCSLLEPPEFVVLSTICSHEDHNHLMILVYKLFKRMVVDDYVYHKYWRSRGCIMVLILQLEHYYQMFGGKAGKFTSIDSCKRRFPQVKLATIKQSTTRRYPGLSYKNNKQINFPF
jgi:hypothetical protein